MALDSLISLEFSEEELKKIDGLLTQLEEAFKSKIVSLTPDQRKEFSRVGIKTEDWIVRIDGYIKQYPQLVLSHINQAEFDRDFKARQALLPRLRRLKNITAGVDDTVMAIGSDLYGTAITYYKGIKILADTNAPNAQPVYNDLKQQFPGRPSSRKTDTSKTSTEVPKSQNED